MIRLHLIFRRLLYVIFLVLDKQNKLYERSVKINNKRNLPKGKARNQFRHVSKTYWNRIKNTSRTEIYYKRPVFSFNKVDKKHSLQRIKIEGRTKIL